LLQCGERHIRFWMFEDQTPGAPTRRSPKAQRTASASAGCQDLSP